MLKFWMHQIRLNEEQVARLTSASMHAESILVSKSLTARGTEPVSRMEHRLQAVEVSMRPPYLARK